MNTEHRDNEIKKTYNNMVLRHFAKGYIMNFLSMTYGLSKSYLYKLIKAK